MKGRLKELRKYLKLTQGEFGKRIGVSDVAVSYMESGRTAISDQNLYLICLTFGANEEWLRNGEGDMINSESQYTETEKRLLGLFGQLSIRAQDMVIGYAEKLLADEVELRGGDSSTDKTEKLA